MFNDIDNESYNVEDRASLIGIAFLENICGEEARFSMVEENGSLQSITVCSKESIYIFINL